MAERQQWPAPVECEQWNEQHQQQCALRTVVERTDRGGGVRRGGAVVLDEPRATGILGRAPPKPASLGFVPDGVLLPLPLLLPLHHRQILCSCTPLLPSIHIISHLLFFPCLVGSFVFFFCSLLRHSPAKECRRP